jgi:hypothetical protein
VIIGQWIPISLELSTGVGVIVNLLLGRLFDRTGLPIVLVAVLLSSASSPFLFFGNFDAALFGILLWGGGLCDPGHAAQGAHCHRLARRTT